MLFNSLIFVLLLAVTFALHYSVGKVRYQVFVLIAASAIFYAYSQPYLLLLLLFSAVTNAVVSYQLIRDASHARKKALATCGVLFNLAVLAFFKYNRLLDDLFINGSGDTGDIMAVVIALPLPIGISFYTFQGISLLVDIYKDKKSDHFSAKSFPEHLYNSVFYIVFFPQLIAGPIVKAQDFLPQIRQKYINNVDYYFCYKTLVVGFFLKSVIADNLKDQTFWIAAPHFAYQSTLTLIVMLFGYSMQIFADFAGYSLIAIGIAALFGYRLPDNFNFPYISVSITEFWQRWHISLSSWLKEYLYIGLLGGNRRGDVRTYVNLIIVMFLGGLWHGAAISYGVWGLWHGMGLAIERWLAAIRGGKSDPQFVSAGKMYILRLPRLIFTFVFVSFGWLFFKLNEFSDVSGYVMSMLSNTDVSHNKMVIFNIAIYSLPVLLYHTNYVMKQYSQAYTNAYTRIDFLIYALLFALVLMNGGIPGDFVYFQF